MSWLLAIGLAAVCFAAVAFAFRTPRALWTAVLAALAVGLAGFAFQASTGLPGAPAAQAAEGSKEAAWAMIEARQTFIGEDNRSANPKMITADAMARNAKFVDAASLASAAAEDDPQDIDAWVALGNALVENSEGTLTPAALLAYRRAAAADPASLAPGFFMGVALVRQGRLLDAREAWAEALQAAPENAAGREELETRLAILDELLRRIAQSEGGD